MARRYMLDIFTAYEQQAKAAVLSPGQGLQLALYATHLTNRSGAAQDMGILIKLANATWKFLNYIDPGPATDATAAIQAGATQDIFTTTNNDGFVIQATKPFNLVGFAVTQAETGAPVYDYKYFDGTAFVSLPDILNTPSYTTVGDKVLLFSTPRLWVPGTTGAVGGTAGLYTLWAQATTAPTQAVQANDAWMGHMLAFEPQLGNNQILSLLYDDKYPRLLDGLEGLLPFFATAAVGNLVTVKYFNY